MFTRGPFMPYVSSFIEVLLNIRMTLYNSFAEEDPSILGSKFRLRTSSHFARACFLQPWQLGQESERNSEHRTSDD